MKHHAVHGVAAACALGRARERRAAHTLRPPHASARPTSLPLSPRSVAGIGTLPYYVRRLTTGEYPRPKDDFEKFVEFQRGWDAVSGGRGRAPGGAHGRRQHTARSRSPSPSLLMQGAPYARTHAYQADKNRAGLELEWRAMHAAQQR